ncbi:FAD-dependent monooxygenase [Muricoccus aerilatus]|uniref:FAD-dependent monooxygenase n=1 Tax=Muricoccus aerilatus TaxID=452982 RepID=UPI0005C20D34|nr:FAD-dependent monooxygenase [Roseomonas aerilata]
MSDNHDSTQVIIVGGGPVGTGLAIELALRGVRSILVERYPSPQPIPKGQNLTQRTMEHFHFWGAEAALRAARTIPPEYGMGGLTAYGTLLGEYQHDWLQRELVRQFYFTGNERLPQYATEAVLRARAATLPGITTLYGWTAEGVEQDADGVTVTVAERKGTGRRTLRAAYAVGCDGSKSTVREAAGITQTRSDHDRLMVLLVFRSEGLHELLKRYPGKSFYNVLHPDLEGYWQFFGRVDLGTTWFFHAPVPADTTKDNTDFTAMLHRAAGAQFDAEFEHIGFWDLRFAIADSYRKGRLFVAGDAAHSHPPYGGYGINTGLEDAVNLGWKLAACFDGWGGQGLLDSYDAERRPVFASTAGDFIERSIHVDRDFLAAHDPARDRAGFEAGWATRTSSAAAEVASFEPNYEGSPIVQALPGEPRGPSAVGTHSLTARAGHHLAPQVMASGRNVYEELSQGFSLLSTSPDGTVATEFREAANRLGMPLAVIALSEEARRNYAAENVLVRPDQFVAWAGESAEAEKVLAQARGG